MSSVWQQQQKAFVCNFIQGYFPTIMLLVIYTPWTLSERKPRRDSCIALNERPVGFPELVRVEEEQRHKPLAAGYEGECRRIPGACSASTSSTVSHSFFPWGFTSEALTRLFLKWLCPARQDLGQVNEGSVRTAEPLFKDTSAPPTPPPHPHPNQEKWVWNEKWTQGSVVLGQEVIHMKIQRRRLQAENKS